MFSRRFSLSFSPFLFPNRIPLPRSLSRTLAHALALALVLRFSLYSYYNIVRYRITFSSWSVSPNTYVSVRHSPTRSYLPVFFFYTASRLDFSSLLTKPCLCTPIVRYLNNLMTIHIIIHDVRYLRNAVQPS